MDFKILKRGAKYQLLKKKKMLFNCIESNNLENVYLKFIDKYN